MSEVKLPALIGDTPLAVLAAIGTLRLMHQFVDAQARLCWDPDDRRPVLFSACASVGDVASALSGIVAGMPEGVMVPGCPAGFPPPGEAPDRLRLPPGELQPLLDSFAREATPEETAEIRRWLSTLLTDLAVDGKGRGAISLFTAPSGKQTMATMFEKPLLSIRKEPDALRQALCGWRRVHGVTGEYLDHRAMWDATEDSGGNAEMRGVPGATWLALMSFPLWTTTSHGKHAVSSGWHLLRHGRRVVRELRLPLWKDPLGPTAVKALVEHPALGSVELDRAAMRKLGLLGVFHVCRARRYQSPESKSAGVLAPVP